ncbi:gephyrin-like molybdotransferase Glp [Methylomonas methanica]|uniref:Molybdopterin molybdenumtransferase n=1 Tax=Methylomonas methanica (strain DSM 25384 / MC09) TaxID=857087 RepID=F9ZVY5_METMM|nr:gephyrin-like molybdotransferase Glp [Methylomonas methanica]AEG00789.1 molybdenum cofactor synthesis domain protein [Methylomonas methanica MC09]
MTGICYPKTAALLSVAQARQNIQLAVQSINEHEIIPLPLALGRVLAESVYSAIDIPPQRNAAMDGYAFSSADIAENPEFTLQVVGTSWAGKPYTGPIEKYQCVRIFTGAVVPEFADSVIAQEQVTRDGNTIRLPDDTLPYKNIRAAGSDVVRGEVLITAPQKLTARDLGLLAAAGVVELIVKRQLKVGFFSTGDELTGLENTLQSGQIYDSNRYMLAGLLNDSNYVITDLGVIRDDPPLLEKTLVSAAACFDVLISSGGASVGDADFVKQILQKCGQVNFWKLAIKPGKPLAFGRIGNCWFFGLPGNPIAVLVTYQQFVKPALQQLAGAQPTTPIQLTARCEDELRKSPGRQEYQRGILKQTAPGVFTVTPAGRQDSHQQKVASLANCFIVLDNECGGVGAGDMVTVEPFDVYL